MTFSSSLINANVPGPNGRASLRLEPAFWTALKEEAGGDVAALIAKIDAERTRGSLASAVRVWLLAAWMARGKLAGTAL